VGRNLTFTVTITITNECSVAASVYQRIFPRKITCSFYIRLSSPVTDLEWPRGFQEVKVPRLRDNGTGRW